jgi:peroxiredoxin Q/BCP
MPKLKPGVAAPDFALVDQDGETVKLKNYRGEKLVVYFYPKADTPGCTTQSCNVRDAERDLAKLGAQVVGISPDPPPKQKRFDEKYGLGFPLLADEDNKVAKAWGVWGEKSMYGKKYKGIIRSAFVIDEKGKVIDAFYKVSPKDTVPKATAALEESQ